MDGFKVEEYAELSKHCSWDIGGPARYLVTVKTADQLARAIQCASQSDLQWFVLGKGSNCLFDDRGYQGLVILNEISFLEDNGHGLFKAGGGFAFNQFGSRTARQGWAGLEFAVGIPGTVCLCWSMQ